MERLQHHETNPVVDMKKGSLPLSGDISPEIGIVPSNEDATMSKSPAMLAVEATLGDPFEMLLPRLYAEHGSERKITKYLKGRGIDVGRATVGRWLTILGVQKQLPAGGLRERKSTDKPQLPSKAERMIMERFDEAPDKLLSRLHGEDGLTQSQIERVTGVPAKRIGELMKKYGIPRRTAHEAQEVAWKNPKRKKPQMPHKQRTKFLFGFK